MIETSLSIIDGNLVFDVLFVGETQTFVSSTAFLHLLYANIFQQVYKYDINIIRGTTR
jgi:hypothetical protein